VIGVLDARGIQADISQVMTTSGSQQGLDLVARVLAVRGDAPGLVHVISAMEACPSYKPWLDKSNGHVYLRADQGKCLHYYFYFIDEEFGLCYLRVPTWAPFGLQFYCNGHSALARSLRRQSIEFVQEDNAFLRVADLGRAQVLADAFNPEQLHRRLTRYAHWLCPVADVFAQDDWHLNPKLTLNLGIRWDLFTPYYEKDNKLANYDPTTGRLLVAGQNGVSRSTLDTTRHWIFRYPMCWYFPRFPT